jgi:hypothetical protein
VREGGGGRGRTGAERPARPAAKEACLRAPKEAAADTRDAAVARTATGARAVVRWGRTAPRGANATREVAATDCI